MVLTLVVAPWSSSCASTAMLSSSWVGKTKRPNISVHQHQRRICVVLDAIGLQQQQHSSEAAAAAAAEEAEEVVVCTNHHEETTKPCAVEHALPMSRWSILQRVTSVLAVGAVAAPAAALDAQRDARTALPPPPALLLPVMKVRVATTKVLELLGDPSRWEEAKSLLSSPPLSSTDFARILDRYSDSNWEKHILGDLYRNQGLASIKALDEVMTFALQQQANGVDVVQDDIDDVREAGRALADSLDDFLALAPPEDLRMVQKLVTEPSR